MDCIYSKLHLRLYLGCSWVTFRLHSAGGTSAIPGLYVGWVQNILSAVVYYAVFQVVLRQDLGPYLGCVWVVFAILGSYLGYFRLYWVT